jgi:hypothetical protein
MVCKDIIPDIKWGIDLMLAWFITEGFFYIRWIMKNKKQ